MNYELIALLMFAMMMLMLVTGQRVFGAIGFVATVFAVVLWGKGGAEMPFASTITLLNWYPMLTLPMFIYMGYMLSESGIASDLYKMFHVWAGPLPGGLAIGTVLLMVAISAMNGLSVAGMAIGASVALPELLKRNYDKVMVTGVIQAGSSLGIMIPPSVVLVLYGMIARQPVGQLWLAGVFPGLLLATLLIAYILIRCKLQPHLLGQRRPEVRLDLAADEDVGDEQRRQQQPGEHARQPQLADGLPGDHPVQHQHHARRDHDAERAARLDDAGHHDLVVIAFQQLG